MTDQTGSGRSTGDAEGPPAITLPGGGGAIRGIGEKFGADPVTGTAGLRVPMATSPGRGGFGPELSLTYSSGAGNGAFGLGWSLHLGSVTRKTDKGLPEYRDADESDVFMLSDVEDLVPVLDAGDRPMIDTTSVAGFAIARYRPRVEQSFARIERWTSQVDGDVHWRSYSSANVLAVYGRDANSRVADPDDPTRIFGWLLCQTRDDKGNAIVYRYKAEDAVGVDVRRPYERSRFFQGSGPVANRYLKRVLYGNQVPLLDHGGRRPIDPSVAQIDNAGWMFEAVLDYGEHDPTAPTPVDAGDWLCRHDPFSTFRPGFEVRTYRLCQRVLMFHHFPEPGVGPNTLVRSTELTYRSSRGEATDGRLGNPVATLLESVTQSGHVRVDAGYRSAALPALAFEYSDAIISTEVQQLDPASLERLPIGIDETTFRWVDLDGEGIPGVLAEQDGVWYYQRNDGGGRLGSTLAVTPSPTMVRAKGGYPQLVDLAGDGRLNAVQMAGSTPGFHARTIDVDEGPQWEDFTPFASLPTTDWSSSDLMMVDLTGDGRADLLLVDDNRFSWYPALDYTSPTQTGFEPSRLVTQPFDEDRGPRLVQRTRLQSVFLADMSGDGLTDLVRVRNGEVRYWPNLGYGRFGPAIVMGAAPVFDAPDLFDSRRLRLADIDGSGTVDLIYIAADGVRCWANEAGNGWGAAQQVSDLPHLDDHVAVQVADLLGNGTACLLWSSPLPGDSGRAVRYVDLMGGNKPHLMTTLTNNMGAQTRVHYTASTTFYLADRSAGRPWLTRLPFPVHVVDQVEQLDFVSRTRFSTKYSYHHGYFDGIEREFRGFAMVECEDTEAYEDYVLGVVGMDGTQDTAPELYQPPVTTRTWYHTGAYLDRDRVLHQLSAEYYGQTQLTAEPTLGAAMDERDARESLRALKGLPLRQEVYCFDGTPSQSHPYSVVEYHHVVELLQRRGDQRHGVYFARGDETLTFQYDRNPADPRIAHCLSLEVGPYGNILRSATVGYGRLLVDPQLPPEVTTEQQRIHIQYGESDYTPDIAVVGPDPAYRLRAAYESRSFEITGVAPAAGLFTMSELDAAIASAAVIDYEIVATGASAQKRLIGMERLVFRDDSLAALPLGQLGSLGLSHAEYKLAYTPGVVAAHLAGHVSDADLVAAGYVHLQGDANWWAPSSVDLYAANPEASFYLPSGRRSPLGVEAITTLDAYHLLPVLSTITQAPWYRIEGANDYRVLHRWKVTDSHGNRTAVAFDELGMVVRSAVMGRDGAGEGDTLDDPTLAMEYAPFNWRDNGKPTYAKIRAREKHGAANPRWQESYTYSNGHGAIAMVKVQARPGTVTRTNPDGTTTDVRADPRWVGNGRLVINNKGKPVKRYEPFFSDTSEFDSEEAVSTIGVTAIRYYDPPGRLVRTAFPDGTLTRCEFTPWLYRDFDPTDTVRDGQWYVERGSPDPATEAEPLADPQRRAAWLTAKHANTPTTVHLDALARPVCTVSDYGNGTTAALRTDTDFTRARTAVFDQLGRQISTSFNGMLGQPVMVEQAETGRRGTFTDVAGAIVRTWDDQGNVYRGEYDALRRPVRAYLTESGGAEKLSTYVVYGDRNPAGLEHNLLGAVHQVFDGAGMIRVNAFDFKGNSLSSDRVLVRDPLTPPDWTPLAAAADYSGLQAAATALLDGTDVWTVATEYDALNRAVTQVMPDATIVQTTFDEGNVMSTLTAQPGGAGAVLDILRDQDCDAKGRRMSAFYGNGIRVEHTYDRQSERLVNVLTYLDGTDPSTRSIQDLHYTWDPCGNLTESSDDAQQTYFFNNAVVRPSSRFEYDAVYQVVHATGREHAGGVNDAIRGPGDLTAIPQLPYDNDLGAVREYTEDYTYDLLGNITTLRHGFKTQNGVGSGWTRHYRYAYQDDPSDQTNRLGATSTPADPDGGPYSAHYGYDAGGRMTSMPHLSSMAWNSLDQLTSVDLGNAGMVHYQYDGDGTRVRKVIETPGGKRQEWVYLGAMEVYRERTGNATPTLERRTTHVGDDVGRVAQVDTLVTDLAGVDTGTVGETVLRFHLGNHIGSTVLETDSTGQVISYQEYHPYGTTAYHYIRSAPGLYPQRYQFAGQERDGETGLDYAGARYYASWLGRWTSSDPTGLSDGPNTYAYCGNNPVTRTDPSGTDTVASVAATRSNRRLLDPARYDEARAYLEGVYSSRLQSHGVHSVLVIDRMHFKRMWIIDVAHVVPINDAGTTSDPQAATTGAPGGNSTAQPDAAAGANAAAQTDAHPDGSTDGSTTGSAEGTAARDDASTTTDAAHQSGGSAEGSKDGHPGGQAGGSSNGSPQGTLGGTGSGPAQPPHERSFWDRGGRALLLGLGILALGVLTVLTGGGALVMVAGYMAIAAGGITALGSAGLLTASYAGYTSAETDRVWQTGLSDFALVASSPGSLLGGAIGYAANGREGMRTGAMIGGITEGVAALGYGAARAVSMRAGAGLAEPLGEVTIEQWAKMTSEQRSLYELGQTTVRSGVWRQIEALGIEGNPIAKGRFLKDMFGGSLVASLKYRSLFGFFRTMGTGGTPMARYVGSWLMLGATNIVSAIGARYSSLASEVQ